MASRSPHPARGEEVITMPTRLRPSNAEELTLEDQAPASGLRNRSYVKETDFQPRHAVAGVRSRHSLPGLELTDDAFSSAASIMFDQAENRLHAIRRLSLRHSDN
jgi:hypothetical protein